MKVRLPFVNRKAHDKEVEELLRDINALESFAIIQDENMRKLHSKIYDKDFEIEILKEQLVQKEKEILRLKWCIKERDSQIKNIIEYNNELYKKVELSNEMYRQFKDKIDKALEVDFTKTNRFLTVEEVKKFLKLDDVIELYTLIGIAGK